MIIFFKRFLYISFLYILSSTLNTYIREILCSKFLYVCICHILKYLVHIFSFVESIVESIKMDRGEERVSIYRGETSSIFKQCFRGHYEGLQRRGIFSKHSVEYGLQELLATILGRQSSRRKKSTLGSSPQCSFEILN